MKRDRVSIDKRRQQLLLYLRERQTAEVAELAHTFGVSPITARRDIQYFEEKGLVERYFGGVRIRPKSLKEEPTFEDAGQDVQMDFKCALAKKCCELIEEGDTLFINSSSTALFLYQFLLGKSVTVITNNGRSLLLPRDPKVELVLTGGEVYGKKKSLVGEFALNALSKVTATKCVIGASGISVRGGITSSVIQETAINQTMLRRCTGAKIALVDGSKVGLEHNFFSGPITGVTHIITNSRADPEEVERIREKGITVLLADR